MISLAEAKRQREAAKARHSDYVKRLEEARADLDALTVRIEAGDGAEEPALFGDRRNLSDLVDWLRAAVMQANEEARRTNTLVSDIEYGIEAAKRKAADLQKQLDKMDGDARHVRAASQTQKQLAELERRIVAEIG